MNKKLPSKSAFFNPRVLISFTVCAIGAVLALIAFSMSWGVSAQAQKPKGDQSVAGRPDVVPMAGPVSEDRDLRTLPHIPSFDHNGEANPRRTRYPRVENKGKQDAIQAVRQVAQLASMPPPIATYPGITSVQSGCGCLPPDTHGDVGPNHYIQSVNSSFKIIGKTGTQLLGPTTFNSFFSGLVTTGTPCGINQNRGDGIIFYDHLADRWVISDFAFPNFPGPLFYQCIGVSKTSDPVAGGWWLYALQIDPANPTHFGDYGKFGLWPDAYYLTVNLFTDNLTFVGVRVFALPRNDLLNGTGAPNPGAIAYTIEPAALGDSYSLVPATFRTGNPPPPGTDQYLLSIDSPAVADVVQTQVHAWRFHVDFATPANSSLGVGVNHAPNANITVNPFVDGFTNTGALVPQNGTPRTLDTQGDKLMTPMVYQNLGGTESLWVSHTVNNNQNGTGPSAIRWYQFNVTGNTIPATAAQQQSFNNAADGIWRFQPSLSVDGQGNMAIGYSASSAIMEPSIRYAGRLASDPPNSLARGEAVMTAGTGHQTSMSGRWGDYSGMGLDPSDNATFWLTHEYYTATSNSAWNTRIGKFAFPLAPVATRIVSRKSHGAFGDFNINLPATGDPGIENRTDPVTNGQHRIVATFPLAVSVASAGVTSGTGTVDNFGVNGGEVTINLSGVADAQRMTITLTEVNDGTNVGNVAIPIAFLLGDSNGNGSVNATDISLVKAESGQPLNLTNFRTDVVANGDITTSDIGQVKARSGRQLPPP